jgi:hypothetical protein
MVDLGRPISWHPTVNCHSADWLAVRDPWIQNHCFRRFEVAVTCRLKYNFTLNLGIFTQVVYIFVNLSTVLSYGSLKKRFLAYYFRKIR